VSDKTIALFFIVLFFWVVILILVLMLMPHFLLAHVIDIGLICSCRISALKICLIFYALNTA